MSRDCNLTSLSPSLLTHQGSGVSVPPGQFQMQWGGSHCQAGKCGYRQAQRCATQVMLRGACFILGSRSRVCYLNSWEPQSWLPANVCDLTLALTY